MKWTPPINLPSSLKLSRKRGEGGSMNRNEVPLAADDQKSPAITGSNAKTYQSLDNTEDAEDSILSNLEAQAKLTRTGSDGFRPAVPGERAPLGVDSLGTALDSDDEDDDAHVPPGPPRTSRPTFKEMAMRVQTINRLRSAAHAMSSNRSVTSSHASSNDEIAIGHRRAQTLLESIDEAAKEEEENKESHHLFTDFSTDLFAADHEPDEEHEGLKFLWNEEESDEFDDAELDSMMALPSVSASRPAEGQPLLGNASVRLNPDVPDAAVILERRRLARQRRNELRWKRVKNCLNPMMMVQRLLYVVVDGTFVVSIPCFIISGILFYYIGNPRLDFLPGDATVSWWFNFLGRQLLVFELAKFTQFLIIDVLTMSSRTVVQMLGPWVTIFCLQSKGWPFLVAFWGLYDMLLLHGDNHFQTHWLYWTGIRIYSTANSGSYILSSSAYLRVLIGMVLAGIATTLKRTVLTLYFGKRSFDVYKPKLEEILNDIIVITEIAELGAEADNLPDDTEALNTKELVELNLNKRASLGGVHWSSVKFKSNRQRTDSDASSVVDASTNVDSPAAEKTPKAPENLRARMSRMSTRSSSSLLRIKNLLDRWEEPVNKLDQTSESSVADILKFRKALTYMDLEHPFGEAFGPASTRDELINSAQALYHRLLKLSPGTYSLPFAVLSVLSENDDGTVNRNLKKSIQTLFRADRDGEVPILAFIQNCDVVYRKLRYFRASVGNASVIDKVLEGILNGLYAFGLTIVIMSLLNFNPWPLLVSVSTLLVSFAFAIGPTAAKAIEGILLIVGTRPFDIGDRIIIANQPGQPSAGVADSWFVEDITLFSTTLRLGANNEVATISNGAIASTRITNCQRSKNAVVNIVLKLHISMHDGRNVDKFEDGLENYINDNPSVWDSLVFLRCEDINGDDEYVIYRLGARSRLSWQLAARIFADRGRLHQYCVELSKQLGVNFDSPTSRKVLYYGGNLVDGAIKDFKKNLLMDRNNISRGDMGLFGSRMDLPVQRTTSQDLAGAGARARATPGDLEVDRETETPRAPADDLFLSMVQQSQE